MYKVYTAGYSHGEPTPCLNPSHSRLYQDAKNGAGEPIDTMAQTPRTPAGAGTRPTSALASGSAGGATGSIRLGSGAGGGGVSSSSRVFNPVSSAEPYFRPFNVTPSSASQFVLAEGSRGSPSPLLVHQPPVLNTEELYRAAGWMTPLPKEPKEHGPGGADNSDEEEAVADGRSTCRVRAGNKRLAMLSAKNEQHDTSQRMAHSLALGGSGGGAAAGAAAAATAAGVAATEAEAAVDAGTRTADRIRGEIAREPVLSLANLDGFGGEPGVAGRDDDGSGSEAGGAGSSSGEMGPEPGQEEGAEEPGIPKSIAEIYEASVV